MIRLLVVGLVFTLSSLALAAPTNNTAQHKGIVFPKKGKTNATEKMEDHKITIDPGNINSTEATTDISHLTPHITFTIAEESTESVTEDPTEQENVSMEPQEPQEPEDPEDPESVQDEASPQDPQAEGSEAVSDNPLPPDANDGLIEYNLGNPLALKLHLPWWPLKDMLRSIQDAISVMNLTMNSDKLEADNTKTKIVQFDDRNYTLKVRVFKPHENNRLLVRLISLTPVIDEGKTPTEKVVKIDDEDKNETLEESASHIFHQVKKPDEEMEEEEKGDDHDVDPDDDDNDEEEDDKKEEKKKAKDYKKEKQNKKKKEEKKGSDSEGKSD